jgi:hypothetical protein
MCATRREKLMFVLFVELLAVPAGLGAEAMGVMGIILFISGFGIADGAEIHISR